MIRKKIKTNKKNAYQSSIEILNFFECDIVSSNFDKGLIEAKMRGNIFSYGHEIKIKINSLDIQKVELKIKSNSVGLQVIDWGTNSENEEKLMNELINKFK